MKKLILFSFLVLILYECKSPEPESESENLTTEDSLKKKKYGDSLMHAFYITDKNKDSIKKSKIDSILKPFHKEHDEFNETTFYTDKGINPDADKIIYVYLGRKANTVWIRLKIRYTDEDWLFVRNWTLKSGDKTIQLNPSTEIERDNGYGSIWEWCDMPLEMEGEAIVTSIISNEKNILRFNGDQYYYDLKISQKQRQAIEHIWNAANFIKGLN